MIKFFLIAVFAGPQMLPFPQMKQGSAFMAPPTGQDISAVHPQFRPVASLLKAGMRLSFETQDACQAFVHDEILLSGGVQALCQASSTVGQEQRNSETDRIAQLESLMRSFQQRNAPTPVRNAESPSGARPVQSESPQIGGQKNG